MPADLENLLSSCRAELATEVSRRRWGRGLDYFLARCSSSTGTERVALARDVLEFLTGSYGLARASEGRNGALGSAVEALARECVRSAKEDPTPLYAWGVIAERDSAQRPGVERFIKSARELEPESGGAFTFNPVILVAGDLVKPDWSGLGRLYINENSRLASLKMFPPTHLDGPDLASFLLGSIEAGLDRTDQRASRKQLPWPTEPHRRLLSELGHQLQRTSG